MVWKKQGPAVTAPLTLADGTRGRVVLVAGRENPKGAVVLVPGAEQGSVNTTLLTSQTANLVPEQLVEILCMQERVFGHSGLSAPDLP